MLLKAMSKKSAISILITVVSFYTRYITINSIERIYNQTKLILCIDSCRFVPGNRCPILSFQRVYQVHIGIRMDTSVLSQVILVEGPRSIIEEGGTIV